MLSAYITSALRRARYTQLEDGSYCAEVSGLRGVIATGSGVEDCREALQEVIEEWVLLRVSRGLDVPVLDGARVRVPRAA
ncbi:MAG: type II toxin-antitoxin system HicB family antitoxin [Candidatus Wallbacteria bacterium]|nr:type II toxin-antitoxin system HicB family antitoxin [Candidatus Wallbacteria bacterium]